MKIRSCGSVVSVLACASVVCAQGVHNNQYLQFTQAHGMTFSTIRGPVNPISLEPNVPFIGNSVIRSVAYDYRISTTELTVSQYFRFVEAVAPHIQALGGTPGRLAGSNTLLYLGMSGGIPRYQMLAGSANIPARNTIEYFALMANWMHNGSPGVNEATMADFQSGAYADWRNPVRSEGAQVWIPSRDEWNKAVYWDPNRDGPGQGGYWLYPNASNEPLNPGDPALGGETNAGTQQQWPAGHDRMPWDVGSYPDVQTPWGLLDASGGGREWTDTKRSLNTYFVESTGRGETDYSGTPILGYGDSVLDDRMHRPFTSGYGGFAQPITVRFAAAIPAPGVPALLGVAAFTCLRRRR